MKTYKLGVLLKKLLIGTLLLSSISAFAAPILSCEPFGSPHDGDFFSLFHEHIEVSCFDKNNHEYQIEFSGVGPGLKMSMGSFFISCPLVRTKKLKGTYAGVKVSAVAGLGVTTAIISNSRLGMCFLGGLEVGLGGIVTIGKMEIR